MTTDLSDTLQRKPASERLRSVYFWAMSGTFTVQGALWLLTLITMRFLQPSDYGLFAAGSVLLAILRTIQDTGLGSAIVQSPTLNLRHLNAAFWFFVITGIVLTAGGFFAAPLLDHLKGEPRLPLVLRALSPIFVIVGIRTVPMSLITRALHFRERSIAEFSSALTGSVTTLILAYAGCGVWSLLIGNLLNETMLAAACWLYAGWRPSLDCDWSGLTSFFRFGVPLTFSTLLWQLYYYSDLLIIGFMLGPQQLGFYTIARQIGLIPVDRLSAVSNKANLPVFSRLQEDVVAIRRHWSRLISIVAWTAFPVAAGMALVGAGFIHLFLTNKWNGSIAVLTPLCILGGLRAITVILPNLVLAAGSSFTLLKYNFVCCLIYPAAIAVSGQIGGIVCVAWSLVLLCPLLYLWLIDISQSFTPLKRCDYFEPLQAPFLTALTMASLVWVVGRIVSLPEPAQLALQILTGIVSYGIVAGLWLWRTNQLSIDRLGIREIGREFAP